MEVGPLVPAGKGHDHLFTKAMSMRCPKCGFISFDHLEVCKKCRKNISDTSTELNGTAYDYVAPLFLQLLEKARMPEPARMAEPEAHLEEPSLFSSGDGGRSGIDTEFVLEDEPAGGQADRDGEDSDFLMDLDEFSEVSPRGEYTIDLAEKNEEDEPRMPSLDFGDLDISDLAPPATGGEVKTEKVREPALADQPVASFLATEPADSVSPQKQTAGLEDLQFNGLNLDTPARFVAGSVTGKRYSPSVRTGTALDNFDINLGDLFKGTNK